MVDTPACSRQIKLLTLFVLICFDSMQCQFDDCMSYNTKLLRQFRESDMRIASADSEIHVNLTH